ncbi:hypothetical protein Pelo_8761 [Pelomyxa schiedti]|nr:hypothetical protein Pelo_8761 [Pelomyxa schiedti]
MGVGVGFLSGMHLKTLLLLSLFVIVGTPAWATSQQPRELAERASCFVCKQGQYSFECNPQEIDCPGGYCDSVCPDCPPGTCAPLIETINCTVCSAGYYTADYGTTNCSACNAGSYSKSPAVYMPPEVIKNNSAASKKSDIHAFGLILWETWTGQELFSGVSDLELECSISGGLWPRIPPEPETPPALKHLMILCWNEDPKMRPDACYVVDQVTDIRRYYKTYLQVQQRRLVNGT